MVPSTCGNPCDATWPEDALTGGVLRPRTFSRQYAAVIASYYDVLGVAPDAPPELIRSAYRDRARQHHPDRTIAADADAMSRINEAYRVLSDPSLRLTYDRSIGQRGAHGSAAGRPTPDLETVERVSSTPIPPSRMMPAGPARMPWKMMLIVATVGAAAVLVGSVFNDPPSTEVPDGILRIGSCVEIDTNGMAREIACTHLDDTVVQYVIPTDGTCPSGLGGYPDRLGLGAACIEID